MWVDRQKFQNVVTVELIKNTVSLNVLTEKGQLPLSEFTSFSL